MSLLLLHGGRFFCQGIDGTIQHLRETLVAMKRTDAIALLDKELELLQPKGMTGHVYKSLFCSYSWSQLWLGSYLLVSY